MKLNFLEETLQQWQDHIRKVIWSIRKSKWRVSNWKKKVWILLLGTQGSGKTALLHASGLALQPLHSSSTQAHKPTKLSDWWVTKQAVFMDPSGECFQNTPAAKALWQGIRHYIKSKRRTLFDSICLVIDCKTLLEADEKFLENLSKGLSHDVAQLLRLNKKAKWYLIITKCDQLTGFIDFFADLNSKEREQNLGFGLNVTNTPNQDPLAIWYKQKTIFLQELCDRVIVRLHREPNPTRKHRIKDFPAQMEQLLNLIETFFDKSVFNIFTSCSGLYFTSALQTGETTSILNQLVARQFNFQTGELVAAPKRKTYFIHDLFPSLLKKIEEKSNKKNYTYTLLTLIILLLVFGGLGQLAYHQNRLALGSITESLTGLSQNKNWLYQLNKLNELLENIRHFSLKYFKWLGFTKVAALQTKIQTTYNTLLKTRFVPYLNGMLIQALKINQTQNASDLFTPLQIYQMLSKSPPWNSELILQWFTNQWNLIFKDENKINLLQKHLKAALMLTKPLWEINTDIVNQAQNALQKEPLPKIILALLQNEFSGPPVPIFKNQPFSKMDLSQVTTSPFYSTENAKRIYQQLIPKATEEIFKNASVIGPYTSPPLTPAQKAFLVREARLIYLKNYETAWGQALARVQFPKASNFKTLLNNINLLQDKDSILWQELKAAKKATLINITHTNSVSETQEDTLNFTDNRNLETGLQALKEYIVTIQNAPSPTKAAFDQTVLRFQSDLPTDPLAQLQAVAQSLPPPLKQWLLELAQNSWQLMLDTSRQYLNVVWKSTVMPEYRSHILNRYPIFKDSPNDISGENFNQFFGPHGTLEIFFNDYFKPFVDTTKIYWTWKVLDGIGLPINQDKLEMLIRASMIQKMFYYHNQTNPQIRFTLTPIELSPNITRFVLNIGGQMVGYEPGIKKTYALNWPGPAGAFLTLRFNDLNPNQPTLTLTGPWAWLRLVDQSKLEVTNPPQTFRLTFKLGENEAQYELIAENPINPYQGQFLSAFRCPEEW